MAAAGGRAKSRHPEQLLQGLAELRQEGTLCDVILSAGNVHVRAHRVVLAGCSPYFRAMFTSRLSEKHKECIELHCVKPTALKQIIDFAYTGEIEVNQSNVLDLLPAARLLQVAGVMEECCDFLEDQLHVSNCVGVAQYADLHACTDLLQKSRLFICRNFTEVASHSEEFLQLAEPGEIKEIISSDNLVVDSETFVYKSIDRWINVNPGEREKHFVDLVSCVRLPLLPLPFLKTQFSDVMIRRRRGISPRDKKTLEDLFQAAIDYKTQGDKRLLCEHLPLDGALSLLKTSPRQPASRLCAVAGKNGLFATLNRVDCYDPATNTWSPLSPLNRNRFEFGVVSLDRCMYVIGGMVLDVADPPSHNHEASVEVWNEETGLWREGEPLLQARSALGVSVLGGFVYALGGYDGEQYLRSVERFSPYTGRWENCAPMEEPRSCFSAVTLEEHIYAIGGYCPPCINSVERYDPQSDTWSHVSSMREKRINFGCASLRGFIFVVGGHNGVAYLSTMERYDPHTDQWTGVTGMGQPRTGLGVSVIGSHLYAIGGHSGALYLNTAQRYDPSSDTWEQVTDMSTSRCSFGLTAF